MLNFIKNFRNDEDGAVTVDWVVLTAALVGIGVAVVGGVKTQTEDVGGSIATKVSASKLN